MTTRSLERSFSYGLPVRAANQSTANQSTSLRIQPYIYIYIYIYQLDKIEKHEKRIQKHRILDGYDRMEEIKIDLKNLR